MISCKFKEYLKACVKVFANYCELVKNVGRLSADGISNEWPSSSGAQAWLCFSFTLPTFEQLGQTVGEKCTQTRKHFITFYKLSLNETPIYLYFH